MNSSHAVRSHAPVEEREAREFSLAGSASVDSRNDFVERNMPLVASIARRNIGRGLDYEDLIQEGSIGLITAAEKFDRSGGSDSALTRPGGYARAWTTLF